MAYLLLVFLIIVLFAFLGLHIGKLEPYRPKILIPLILVSLLIVAAAILLQKPWWTDYSQTLSNLLP